METITGGLANACHNTKPKDERDDAIIVKDNIPSGNAGSQTLPRT